VMDDAIMKAARDVKTRPHALIGRTEYDVDSKTFANYAVQVVKRFGPKGTFWSEHPNLDRRFAVQTVELMNEPYFVSPVNPAKYALYIKPALLALKALRSGVRVIIGTANYASKTKGTLWVKTLFKKIPGLPRLIHGVATHPYWNGNLPNGPLANPNRPFSRIDSLRALLNCLGGKKLGIYITEYGASTATSSEGVSEAVQAQSLASFLRAATRNTYGWNVKMFLMYTLLDWPVGQGGEDATNREAHFGIIRPNGTKKPSYSIVKSYMRGNINVPTRSLKNSLKGQPKSKIVGICPKA